MTSSVIGALRVTLGLDSAQFQTGARGAQRQAENLRRSLMAISAGMAAVTGAAFAMVKSTADTGREVSRLSSIANTSTRDFQRMAAGADTVGISQEKLADILKDVNDRVGDFLQTGGGPMADFFENIAPQVGVTADMFRDLSGRDALQLYVSTLQQAGLSQAEMTFYLEAMASDATALIPLLRDNGRELERLGDAAEAAGAILSDEAVANSNDFHAALDDLRRSLTGVRNAVAEDLMPVFTSMIERITTDVIPIVRRVIEVVGDWITAFQDLPQPVQDAVGIVATALGVGGPVILAIGAVGAAITGLISSAGPIGLFITAASLAAAAWVTWGDDIKAAIGPAVDFIGEKIGWIVETVRSVVTAAGDAKQALIDFFTLADERAERTAAGAEASMRQAGDAIAQGLTQGAMDSGAVDDLRDYLSQFPEAARDELEIRSPSRVFAEIGRFISEGLGLGILQGAGGVADAMDDVVGSVVDRTEDAGAALASLKSTAQSAFTGFVSGAMSAADAAASVLDSLSRIYLDQAFNALFAGAFSPGGLISAVLPGFANGTPSAPAGWAMVGERGPELVKLGGGERIFDARTTSRMLDGGDRDAAVRVLGGDLTLTDDGRIMAMVRIVADDARAAAVQDAELRAARPDINYR